MDPVTAFSLACNVLQVVEVGIKILQQIKEVRDRGSLSANDEVRKWADEVSREDKQLRIEFNATGQQLDRTDIRVRSLAEETIEISNSLKTTLNSIELARGEAKGKANALKQIVRTYMKKHQIDTLSTRLQVCEAALDRTILRDL